MAAQNGHVEILKILLDNNADVNYLHPKVCSKYF